MSKDNIIQLPVEVSVEINAKAILYTSTKEGQFSQRSINAFEAGATEYAIKLHEAGHEIKGLKGDIEVRDWDIKKYNKEIKAACTLLEKFISRHEAGLLPDMFIYKEIKTFLDGTK